MDFKTDKPEKLATNKKYRDEFVREYCKRNTVKKSNEFMEELVQANNTANRLVQRILGGENG